MAGRFLFHKLSSSGVSRSSRSISGALASSSASAKRFSTFSASKTSSPTTGMPTHRMKKPAFVDSVTGVKRNFWSSFSTANINHDWEARLEAERAALKARMEANEAALREAQLEAQKIFGAEFFPFGVDFFPEGQYNVEATRKALQDEFETWKAKSDKEDEYIMLETKGILSVLAVASVLILAILHSELDRTRGGKGRSPRVASSAHHVAVQNPNRQ